MTYAIFLDDERFPAGDGDQINGLPIVIARSFDEAVDLIKTQGWPDMVMFDHDLGIGPSGYDFAKWMVEYDLDNGGMPDNFKYDIHSQNPVGAKNIKTYLDSYLKIKRIKI